MVFISARACSNETLSRSRAKTCILRRLNSAVFVCAVESYGTQSSGLLWFCPSRVAGK